MIDTVISYFRDSGQFRKRIKERHRIFWEDTQAEQIRNVIMSRHDPLEKWTKEKYWQRKLSNKFNAREFAIMHNCLTADLYWRGRNIDNLNFSKLPANFVIRPTIGHSSNQVFLMKGGLNLFDAKRYSEEELRAALKTEVNRNKHLQFLVEEFLTNEYGEHVIPTDYKFYCFKGKIACVYAIKRLSPKTGFGAFFDQNWTQLEKIQYNYPVAPDLKKPSCFDQMVSMAKMLSESYEMFVRIDLYATAKGCVFGEFTPTPSMGTNFTPYGKNLMLKYWDEYCPDTI